jgi:hypothetical protein
MVTIWCTHTQHACRLQALVALSLPVPPALFPCLSACPTHCNMRARRYVIANVNSFRTNTFLPTSLVRRQLDRILKRLFPTRRSSAARKRLSAQQRLVTALGAWMQVAGWPRRARDALDDDACASLSSTRPSVASSSLPAPSASVAAASVVASAVQTASAVHVEKVHTSLRFFSVHVPTPTPPHMLATSAREEIVKWQAQWQHVSPEVRQSVDGSDRRLSRCRLPAGLAGARVVSGWVGGTGWKWVSGDVALDGRGQVRGGSVGWVGLMRVCTSLCECRQSVCG